MLSIFLVACGDSENNGNTDDIEKTENLDSKATENVKDIMSTDSKYKKLVVNIDDYDAYEFDIKDRYKSKKTDDKGITKLDIMRRDEVDDKDETFNYNFALMLAQNVEDGQNYLLFAGDVVNNTTKRVQFNHDFDVIMRDIKVEGSSYGDEFEEDGLVGGYEPEFDGEGWFAFLIDSDEIPEKLEIEFERAWDIDGEGGNGSPEEYLNIDFELDK